uniref:cellulose binding domain-containing protein n=1 Tax=Ruminococcus sp. RTP21198st1_G1_RTP21198_201120 TaxID=3141601 RepID=UPI0034A51F3B
MKLKSNFKRILSGVMSLAMAATLVPSIPVLAEDFTTQNYVYDNYAVSYNVTNSWGDTEVVSVTLSNTGDSTIENWMLYFDPNGSTSSIWDAQWAETSTGVSYVKNAGYNARIEPNSSITFSYTVDNCEAVPEAFKLCQGRINKESGYDVQLVVNETWGDNFNGAIVITNNTDSPIEAWELTFDTNFTITEITNSWAATVTELEPYSYRLKGTYTGTVYANSSVTLGFTGVKNGDPEISNTSLTGVVANESLIDFIKNYPDGVSIYAYGDYNNEANAIDIEWYTDYEAEVFDVWQSDDNESYTLVSEVSDADSYQYVITEDFQTKYFKVSIPNDFGETIESVPFVVTKTEDEYSVDFLDSDGDGLPDIYENMIGTDLNNPDTDGDGLTDYQEVYITGTDPTKYDSVTDGVSDADADPDEDGLTNAQEIELGTDPQNDDTDGDGLKGGEEVNDYHTDPLNPDTDRDGLPDGDEPHIGLDP